MKNENTRWSVFGGDGAVALQGVESDFKVRYRRVSAPLYPGPACARALPTIPRSPTFPPAFNEMPFFFIFRVRHRKKRDRNIWFKTMDPNILVRTYQPRPNQVAFSFHHDEILG